MRRLVPPRCAALAPPLATPRAPPCAARAPTPDQGPEDAPPHCCRGDARRPRDTVRGTPRPDDRSAVARPSPTTERRDRPRQAGQADATSEGAGRRTEDTGRRAQSAGRRVRGKGRRAPGAGHRAQGTGRRAPGAGHRAQGTGRRAPGAGHRAPGAGRGALGAGHRALGAGHRAQGAGRGARAMGAGRRALGAGRWALGAGRRGLRRSPGSAPLSLPPAPPRRPSGGSLAAASGPGTTGCRRSGRSGRDDDGAASARPSRGNRGSRRGAVPGRQALRSIECQHAATGRGGGGACPAPARSDGAVRDACRAASTGAREDPSQRIDAVGSQAPPDLVTHRRRRDVPGPCRPREAAAGSAARPAPA